MTLAPWNKSYDKSRQHTKKQRHHFVNKGLYSQIYSFTSSHGWMFESWTIKNAECQRIDAFKVRCWRRLLWVPWAARRSNQSILKEINPEYTLAISCKEPTHWKRPWCWERLKAKEGDERGWDGWMASLTQWTWVWANSWRSWRTGKSSVL